MKKNTLIVQQKKQIVIAVGSSAGGLEALTSFLTHLPASLHCTIIIAQHLANSPKSQLVKILQRKTTLTVIEATEGSSLALNTVYISPSNKDIQVSEDKIILSDPENAALSKPSIDKLFNSLANENDKYNVFAIVLSGTGKDGSEGIKSIKAAGGYTIVQEPSTADFLGMPMSAIETGSANAILAIEDMGDHIVKKVLHLDTKDNISIDIVDAEYENRIKLFTLLSKTFGTDFSNYKPSTIYRRVHKRIVSLKLGSLLEYLDYIDTYPNELDILYKVILIGVTSFYRDPEAFDSLKKELEKLIANKKQDDTIRVWDIACATGEEAYSIAILLQELLVAKNYSLSIKIFATDIDDKALTIARKGSYKKEDLESIPNDILLKYFVAGEDNTFEVTKDIRKMVFFSKHDITCNPPFIKMDLISCRNLLIYFGANLQKYTIPLFHYSLNTDGILYLGKSESVGSYVDLFSTVDTINKIFIKNSVSSRNSLKPFLFTNLNIPNNTYIDNSVQKRTVKEQIKETLLNTLEYPYVVINENGDIQESNGDLRLFISLASGAMNINLIKLINTEMQLDVRTLFSMVRKENKAGKTKLKRFKLYDKEHFVIVNIKPIITDINTAKLYLVLFETLELSAQISNYSLSNNDSAKEYTFQEMEKELIATKEHLNSFIEELESVNEELQSSNEELQSTNEELQSTNEELQSTGEELQTTNEELHLLNNALSNAHSESKKVNEALNKLNRDLIKADNQLKLKDKEIRRAVITGEEKQRKEISLELHDNICQMMVGAKMLLSSYQKNKKEDMLQDAIDVLDDIVKEIRNLSHVIYLPKEVDEKFVTSIQVLLNQINSSETIKFKIIDDIDDSNKSSEFKINLYRIIQEQVQNVIKYSKAANATILMVNLENKLIVSIKDDGIGCDLNKRTYGIGLSNIKTRVDLFDGSMSITTEEGKGFELKMEFELINIMCNKTI